MIDLYFYPTSNAFRAAIALAECGLPYRLVFVDLARGEHKSDAFARLNPARMIPVLVDWDGPGDEPLVLTQSAAILMYCAEKVGRFLPKEHLGRAKTLQWMFAAMTDVGPTSTLSRSLASSRVPDPSAANARFFEEKLWELLLPFDGALAEGPYLHGDISIADFALYPSVAPQRLRLEQHGGLLNLLAWVDRLAMRPAIHRAMSSEGRDFVSGFTPRAK